MKTKNHRLRLGTIAMLAGISFASQQAQSAAIIYESFSQTPGDLNGLASSGIGLTGNWSDDQTDTIVASTLAYGTLPNAGNQLNISDGNSNDVWVTTSSALSDAGLLNDGAELWFSFMYSKTNNGGGTNEKGGFSLGTDRLSSGPSGARMSASGNGIGARVYATNAAAASWTSGSQTASVGAGISVNTSYLVVGQIKWGNTGLDNDTIDLYLVDTSTLAQGTSISTRNAGALDQSTFDTISMSQRNSGGTVTYDEIRFGASYDDVIGVIPEPSTTALLGLGGLALILRRRK